MSSRFLPTRRTALSLLAGAAALPMARPARGQFMSGLDGPEVPPLPTFHFAQVVYGEGLAWNPHPTAARGLVSILTERTSIQASPERVDLRLSDPKLFYYPFLFWTGTREFEPLPDEEIDRLRVFLEYGGFMLVDDALSAPGVGFDKSVSREMARVFPGEALAKLPEDHTVFQSYYLLDRAVGRTANRPYLSGFDRGDRTALIYSGNDLAGALARDISGKWTNAVNPGGERQREQAIRLFINILMYALCLNYKKDLVHTPFISERRRGNP